MYRNAYFMDFDGKYYKVTVSTAKGNGGIVIYNIGQMKEEALPKIKGSYAGNGNDPRGNASIDSIRSSGGNSQEKSGESALYQRRDNTRTEPDGRDGHVHPNATGDFRYFDTLFKAGNEYYTGVINIMPVNKGLLLKDITKIRNVTKDITGSYGENPQSRFLRDASKNSIRSSGGNSQEKSGESALYQRRDDVRTDRDVLSDAADGDAANVRETVIGGDVSVRGLFGYLD